ncbi:DNA-binding protein [Trinickia mobilis]|uniref:DNA-binding protein n=1 Tax=Trinickia mobilis TaxID=2816356 RepID=UPI001A8ECFB2|nr:DNA-binding protein [Trinickia mobilis]
MAREPNITQDQVSKAAESIRDAGGRPTARAIRERLGTGSMATVLKFFQAWQDAQVRPAEPPVVLPQALQRGLLDFVAAEVDRSRTELRAELDIANQANADLILESERQALTVENLTASLEAVHGEKAELSGRLGQVEAERDAARQDAAAERQAAESARTELAKALLRLEAMPRLENDLGDVRRELEAERTARVNAEQSAAVAIAKLEASIEARQAAERGLEEAKRHEQAKDSELSALRQELKDAQSDAAALRADLMATVKPRSRGPLTTPRQRKKP